VGKLAIVMVRVQGPGCGKIVRRTSETEHMTIPRNLYNIGENEKAERGFYKFE
jgi:hypothetical protein